MIRLAVAGILHETNSFAPGMTNLEHFKREWVQGKDAFAEWYSGTRTTMGGVLSKVEELGAELVPGLYATTTPSGTVEREAFDSLVDVMLRSIDFAHVDGIILIMHGAMAAEGYPDPEGEMLRRIREAAGPDLPVALTLDLHANISSLMVEMADILVGYDTYPHIDMFERAEEAVELLIGMIHGRWKPAMALSKPGMLIVPQAMVTTEGTMKELMEEAFRMEQQQGVLNVTVAGGFPYSDVPDAGMAFVVTTDDDPMLAEAFADRLSQMAWERRERLAVHFTGPEEAVQQAILAQAWPVILTEGSDNVGGGAPADATHLLRLLAAPPVRTLAVIKDEEAVSAAFASGVCGRFAGLVGGKSDTMHGAPVPLEGKVRLLFDGEYRHVGPYMTGQRADMGRTAVIECGNLTVVLTSKRTPPWDLGHVRSAGLWPGDFHIIVVKSAIAWQTAFGAFAKSVIHVDTPGCCTSNLRHLSYRMLSRPVYPLDP